MKITDILRAEHSVYHNLFDHVEATAPKVRTLSEIKTLGALLDRVMQPHSDTEDDLFIGPLEHSLEQVGQNQTFHHEHEMIEELFAKVKKARSLKDGRKFLLDTIAACRKHFDKEERIVFPMAERLLNAKTLSDLGKEWLRRREPALK